MPAGIHSTGPLRPTGLRPVTRRPSMPSSLQETTTNDGSPRKSVSFEPEKVAQQAAHTIVHVVTLFGLSKTGASK